MTTATKPTTTLDVVRTQIGVSEATGNNDGIPATRYAMGENVPWCAALLLWANDESTADAKIATRPAHRWTLRSVNVLEAEMQLRGWWRPRTITPEPGDLIFFATRGRSDKGGGRHVGIVESTFADGPDGVAMVGTIEGNVSNRVARLQHRLDDPRITGYARIPRRGMP